MNMLKKGLIGTALAGSLVVSAGYGTYSWFTAQVEASGTIQNSTLELNNGQTEAAIKFSPEKLAPSRITTIAPIIIENTGEEPMFVRGKVNFTLENNPNNIKPNKFLRAYEVQPTVLYNGQEIADLGWLDIADLQPLLDKWLPSKDGSGSTPNDPGQFNAGDKIQIKLQLRLKENAGNEFQGASLKVDFAFEGKQIDENAAFAKN
ncbi:hypothetical protein ACFVR2_08650 [Gottfriedia sp. NPDC057991]|uniref:hypothetical protein n=1 Tax=Gottfriedia sp. NPDC057991 TaxID=3346298 RepID=UPI0036DE9673